MHEMSLLADLMRKIAEVAREHNATSVKKVRVQIGPLAHISADHFREHFEQAVRGTVAADAVLEVEMLEDANDPRAQDIMLESLEVAAP